MRAEPEALIHHYQPRPCLTFLFGMVIFGASIGIGYSIGYKTKEYEVSKLNFNCTKTDNLDQPSRMLSGLTLSESFFEIESKKLRGRG